MSGRFERGTRRSHSSTLHKPADAPGRSALPDQILGRIASGKPGPDLKSHRLASVDQFTLELGRSVHVALDGRVCFAGERQNGPRLEPQEVAYPDVARA